MRVEAIRNWSKYKIDEPSVQNNSSVILILERNALAGLMVRPWSNGA